MHWRDACAASPDGMARRDHGDGRIIVIISNGEAHMWARGQWQQCGARAQARYVLGYDDWVPVALDTRPLEPS